MKSETILLLSSLRMLENYVSRKNYCGWDPYDALSGKRVPKIFARNELLGMIFLQFNLYFPVNLRPFFRVEEGISNKSLALFARAYLYLYKVLGCLQHKLRVLTLLDMLKANTETVCNAYYFDFVGHKHKLGPNITDIICITESIKTFSIAYEVFRDKVYLNLALKRLEFLYDNMLVEEGNRVYFRYTLEEQGKIVFNVSALALEALVEVMRLTENHKFTEYMEIGKKVVEFLVSTQRYDGAWPYSYYAETKRYYWQLDYHQGFIIDGLNAFLPYLSGILKSNVSKSLSKGITFYWEKLFNSKEFSYYRYPIKYPVDIHNQAQGIITFSKLYKAHGKKEYLYFAIKVANWTIKNMQDPEGYFYTHKWPFIKCKIPYMRWGQAWMMLALSYLLSLMI
ncbi:MAG: hypothetical protein QXI42_07585 [Thermoproteota archaeon]|nr:hypothetical protein [Candidatus Brockarchaeota archaeon]